MPKPPTHTNTQMRARAHTQLEIDLLEFAPIFSDIHTASRTHTTIPHHIRYEEIWHAIYRCSVHWTLAQRAWEHFCPSLELLRSTANVMTTVAVDDTDNYIGNWPYMCVHAFLEPWNSYRPFNIRSVCLRFSVRIRISMCSFWIRRSNLVGDNHIRSVGNDQCPTELTAAMKAKQ